MTDDFLAKLHIPVISPELKNKLDEPISHAEVSLAIASMQPGPDGLPAEFFKHFSDLLSEEDEPEPPVIKEEEDEPELLIIKMEQEEPEPPLSEEAGDQQGLKSVTVTVGSEETDHSTPGNANNSKPLPHSSPVAETPEPDGGERQDPVSVSNAELKPKKKNLKKRNKNSNKTPQISESHPGGSKQSVQCDICRKVLKSKSYLKVHQRRHTGERPFACTHCDKRFYQMYNLKHHERSHTGEKLFFCKICGKSFSYSTPFKFHMKIHSDEKPYSCDTCGKNFRTDMRMLNTLKAD
uniref:C2H2-type domain-containing protein n=1 Tax=Fundulus heteroclitus TaxID=8078 RepID=A0A3Q2TEI5_FUNHE